MELGAPVTVVCDVLIIGSGGAALRAAIEARKSNLEVLLVSKSRIGYGNNTAMAGGLLAAATGWREPKDSPQVHFQDTIRGGRFMNHQKMVEVMAHRSIEEVNELQGFGVKFRKRNEEFSILWFPGHTYPRSLLTANAIGTDFTLPLIDVAQKAGCKFMERVLITRLLTKSGSVVGALGLDESGQPYIFQAKATIMATGGLTQLFARTDNAVGTTGDGMALAYQAGASVTDMEFVQYYPTTLGERGGRGVIYEVLVAREGGKLLNTLGEDILEKRGIKDFVSKTRDVVTRAIAEEIAAGRTFDGFVTLDLSPIPDERLERLTASLPRGFSRENRTMLVAPNAHFTCGGIRTDEETRTGAEGLFAAGEVCAGIHGANRIATNAISEIFVFGAIAGRNAARYASVVRAVAPEPSDMSQGMDELREIASRRGKEDLEAIRHSLKQAMWSKAGPVRSEQSLRQALEAVASLRSQSQQVSVSDHKELAQALRLEKMLTVAEMVVRAAALRTESRGVHYRTDRPERNDKDWLKNIIITRQGEQMKLTPTPVPLTGLAPD